MLREKKMSDRAANWQNSACQTIGYEGTVVLPRL
jgi:hypothetical protein